MRMRRCGSYRSASFNGDRGTTSELLSIAAVPPEKLWGIVLAAGEGTRVREFLARLCGGRGIK